MFWIEDSQTLFFHNHLILIKQNHKNLIFKLHNNPFGRKRALKIRNYVFLIKIYISINHQILTFSGRGNFFSDKIDMKTKERYYDIKF